ncbi:hypothetical protein RJ639_014534 [Escallonia herrerae]|uniref:Integrase catalytic domain-containing protein n=1 Tax=Escallonia herrerae TaxID=1293975 RepID=A0AA89AN92_9ASTE|nr:hypothetical protein RJ639_014534 [Escallonia herrerae]
MEPHSEGMLPLRCQACQFHGDSSHSPPEPLHFTVCSWPFVAWGMDVIGPFTPPSSKGHRNILAATDYFSKWAEAIALRDVKRDIVADFIRTHIIYRFGVPESVIADNAKYFKEGALYKLYANYNIKYNHSSRYHASENGLAEAFNKTLCKILKKMALWAYRTTFRTSTRATLYALVFGSEAVLPLEVQIPSLCVAIQESLTDEESVQIRLTELESLDEKRLIAQQSLEMYQQRMESAFNKRVRLRSFKKWDLVLMVRTPIVVTRRTKGKLKPKWEGLYVIEKRSSFRGKSADENHSHCSNNELWEAHFLLVHFKMKMNCKFLEVAVV